MAVSNKEDFGCVQLTMDDISELTKDESEVPSSDEMELLLQVSHEAHNDLGVKQICDLREHLVGQDESEVHKMVENPDGCLVETLSTDHMQANIEINENSVVEQASAEAIQEIRNFTGVDIISLQPSQIQPMFQLVSSDDGGSYVQLNDSQMIQAVTSGEHGLQTVSLPSGLATLMQHDDKPDSSLEGEAMHLDDGTTAIVHNIQPASKDDHVLNTKLLEGQMIQLEDGTTGFIQAGLPDSNLQSLQLEDGSTAYISLFGDGGSGALSIDSTPQAHDLHAPLQVIAGEEEEEEENIAQQEEESMIMTNIKQEHILHQSNATPTPLETPAIMSDGEQIPTSSTQPHVSYRALALGDKAYKCNYDGCGRLYTTQHHLKVHGRSHTGDKPFHCEFPGCGKSFATGYGLKSHTRVHTGEKPYRCHERGCNKGFKTSGDLQKHIRIHTGERPFKCPFEGCERMFTTSNIRKVHIRTHTGERPYICREDGCNKTFASATNYKNHIRIHTGEKPYVCTVESCGKRFTEYSSLYKHHVVHTQTKPYVCNHCHKTYRQTSTLAMHKRTVHNDDSLDSDALLSTITGVQIVNPIGGAERDCGDTEGALVINTSDAALLGAGNTITQAIPTLQAIQGSTLLQHIQPAGLTVQGAGIQQVYLIADPAQIETLKQLAVQQSGMEDDSPKEGGTSHNGPSIITEPITASATTTAHQLLQNTNPVLTVHPISSNDHLVAYAIE